MALLLLVTLIAVQKVMALVHITKLLVIHMVIKKVAHMDILIQVQTEKEKLMALRKKRI